ncbi:hypothetical protein X798_03571 [Onchocerca flexuosa]|uniref:Uncharacterized protein n=1 Tax=Onchocerca flexuosa TaxID=387005 RepID=A0A238BXF5_9BILA|nr:hypothetical protein X798_03571 [Onchocerca flexuosa]
MLIHPLATIKRNSIVSYFPHPDTDLRQIYPTHQAVFSKKLEVISKEADLKGESDTAYLSNYIGKAIDYNYQTDVFLHLNL